MKILEKGALIADGTNSLSFAKELGVKCDSVGWIHFELDKDKDLLLKIREKADLENVYLRGCYVKNFSEVDAEWYIIRPQIKLALDDYDFCKYDNVTVQAIKAFKVPRDCHVFEILLDWPAFSQQFVDAYERLRLSGIEFCWVPDKGKYAANSFYYPIAGNMAPRVAGEIETFRKKTYECHTLKNIPYDKEQLRVLYEQADSMGGNLLFLEDILDEVQYADIPLMVDYKEMPDYDFVYLSDWVHKSLLVRRTAADKLMKEGVLVNKDLVPVLSFDEWKHNSLISQGVEKEDFVLKIKEILHKEQIKLSQKERPQFIPTEKLTLQALKNNKKYRAEKYYRPLKKAISQSLVGTMYESMIPYYNISDGGRLSDIVLYYSYERALVETQKFINDFLQDDSAVNNDPDLQNCIVIATDIKYEDVILLEKCNRVLQFSFEEHRVVKRWNQLCEFFYDNIGL